jgi:3D (Asp-Asp-Asp) domain-containing protein
MMRNLLENLQSTYIVSNSDIDALEQYLKNESAALSAEERRKVAEAYLQELLGGHLVHFNRQYLPAIYRQLFRNVGENHSCTVTAADILKACLQLNFDLDDFYRETVKWICSYPFNEASPAAVAGLVAKLRQMLDQQSKMDWGQLLQVVIQQPALTWEELLRAEQLWTESTPETTAAESQNHLGDGLELGEAFPKDSLYFNSPEWVDAAAATREFQKQVFRRTIPVASFGLIILAAAGLWLAIAHPLQVPSAGSVASIIHQTGPESEAKPGVKNKSLPGKIKFQKKYINDIRTKRRLIVNRSRAARQMEVLKKKIRASNIPSDNSVDIPVKTAKPSAAQTVVIGYMEAIKDNTTVKIPLAQSFSAKLNLKVTAYISDNSNENITIASQDAAAGEGQTIKSRTVAVNPKVIPPGSRLYIKYPAEYQNFDGVYIAEATKSETSGNQINITMSNENGNETKDARSRVAFQNREVEVYVLE